MNLSIRHTTEQIEEDLFSPYAQLSKRSMGRIVDEEECDIRTVYQRDRDRIIHCKSFRSLKEKTQVFIAKNDFFRTRLTHTLEVNQIGRTIARALRLNEDLVEAIALGHDLGHTCFGHRGEDVLNRLNGNFKHNEQSLRVVDILERDGKGLNLTFEVRDGIVNHTGAGVPLTLEGKLVKRVDRITYLCHDVQDSINAGIFKIEDLPRVVTDILGKSHSERVNKFVIDLIKETKRNIENDKEINIYQSDEIFDAMNILRKFMFENVYYGEICQEEKKKAEFIVGSLYEYFLNHPEEMPPNFYRNIEQEDLNRSVTDFIATCTDSYAIELFKEKFLP
ncbi:deoxyguanosinetriphosphate triphosphohydrolase [Alkaliphilus oremlandii]|uniref:Putative deoxyguanosinetriphosphate triphosphohydrolase n=1 Tax=Alkaliphilus oremlandii (strain OhILAs) TaxID=350688 RepID=A8MG94_ALKOO|nr:deoxyguanosinetriphosphate triphosphohydrolase [Alkaliphilus oremlandii]ABW18822.1 putative deoxyguanosinetriphosphate triphosphohydrolase [Alkaliphilus oremlandii OhILAs]